MARLKITNMVVGVGAGAIDELLEWQDEKSGRTESFKTWKDWGRAALTALGYMGQIMNIMPEYAEPLAQSEVTLLTKSIVKVVREMAAGPSPLTSAMARGARVMTAGIRTPSMSMTSSARSPAVQVAARQPEFEEVRIV